MKSQFKLYEIDEMLREALDNMPINEETGEIEDSEYEFVNAVQIERDKKLIQCALVMQEKKAESSAIDLEIKRLSARKKAIDNQDKYLREYVSNFMQAGEKLKDERISLSCRDIQSYNVINEAKLPEQYFRIKREIARSEISDAVKKGVEVPGIELITKKSITIR